MIIKIRAYAGKFKAFLLLFHEIANIWSIRLLHKNIIRRIFAKDLYVSHYM